jgi:ABC-type dipeptide/oligopeptide/nickel transport system permease component|tara:strand:+ start:84 stop:956 length:873 start_codon:yes stop_codon:yes gene_type:complete
MMFYGGGDPIKQMFLDELGNTQYLDQSMIDSEREKFGLNDPLFIQFNRYLLNVLQGDWGTSFRSQRPVLEMIKPRLWISIQLGFAATLFMAILGIPLGIVASLYHNKWLDLSIIGTIITINAIPVFVTGPILLLFFVLVVPVMNVPYGWNGIFNSQVILPVIVITISTIPIILRQTRSSMLEIMNEDYVRTARAKGLSEQIIIFKHILKPALAPVVTSLGLVMITLINGALFVELIFNIPGFGKMSIDAIRDVDHPLIMSTVLVGTLIVMFSNLVVDVIYYLLDPRIANE